MLDKTYRYKQGFVAIGELNQFLTHQDNLILTVFNQESYENQPQYVIDMDCKDGFLLRYVCNIIKKSKRGEVLEKHPITLIGVASNEQSLAKTKETLGKADIPHSVLPGDPNNPQQLIKDLKTKGLETSKNVLYFHTFGEDNGLILIGIHSLEEKIAPEFSNQSKSLDSVKVDIFLAAAKVGLFPESSFFEEIPKTTAYTPLTFNWQKRPYIIRNSQANEADLEALYKLEEECWGEDKWGSDLKTSPSEIKKRVEQFPEGQFVLEMDNEVIGVIYWQRILDIEQIKEKNSDTVSELHQEKGPTAQLIAVNISQKAQSSGLGLGDQLLEFMLLLCTIKPDLKNAAAVTICQNYPGSSAMTMEAYIEQRNDNGVIIDPILRFHEAHGVNKEKEILNGYRPNDKKNDTKGVLITYNFSKRLDNKAGNKKQAINRDVSPATIVEETIRTILGPQQQNAYAANRPLMEMGLDSFDILELRFLLSQGFGQELAPTFFFRYSTSKAIIDYFERKLQPFIKKDISNKNTVSPSLSKKTVHKESEIAIIGMDCRFPKKTNSPEEYWSLLHNGVDGITEVPPTRWDIDHYYDEDQTQPGKMTTKYGGFLENADMFDAAFFDITPREAAEIDPQHRILLEVSWAALENAGLNPHNLTKTATGVFMGLFGHDYETLRVKQNPADGFEQYFGTSNSASIASGRLAYFFDFQGPAISIDTACSSSLVALHLACQSLQNEECDLALVGGVNLLLSPALNIAFSKAKMMALDGRCKAFDVAANGYVRSEGCGVVVLKPLSKAQADNDNILAVIQGSAINQDGKSNGLTAPSQLAQEGVIQKALAAAGVSAHQISYVEAHGSGTPLGDPIEFEALQAVYGQNRSADNPLILGSAKTNIGHTEAAAGIAGLIKVVLAMQHELIPPHLHFNSPNPNIDLKSIPAVIPTKGMAWPAADKPRLAGISSFGFSGTNAHVILASNEQKRPKVAFLCSGQGSQYKDMGKQLYDEKSVFSETLNQCDEILQAYLEQSLLAVIYPDADDEESKIDETVYTQPALFALEYALAKMWQAWGIEPDIVMGHSVGEYVAACLAGVFTLEDGLKLIAARGRLMQALPQDGAMVAVFTNEAQVQAAIAPYQAEVSIAAVNGPKSIVISGKNKAIKIIAENLQTKGVKTRPLIVSHAFHSPLMEPMLEEFRLVVNEVTLSQPKMDLISNVTGKMATEEVTTVDYWVNHVRDAVRFADGVTVLYEQGVDVFLEVGPQPTLLKMAQRIKQSAAEDKQSTIYSLPSLQQDYPDWEQIEKSLKEMHNQGVKVNWVCFETKKKERPLHLLTLSAKNEAALKELIHSYDNYLQSDNLSVSWPDICFTSHIGRAYFNHHLALTAKSTSQAQEKLLAFSQGDSPVGLVNGHTTEEQKPKVAFLCPGQGAQYEGMGLQLYNTQPIFSETLDQCDEILQPYLEQSLLAVIYPDADDKESKINETAYTQPALFALEYALAKMWQAWGIEPDIVMGHSVGEYVAACLTGVFSLADGLKLIAARGRLMQALPQDGSMVAVSTDEAKAEAAIAPYQAEVSIAAVNGPKSIVISGKNKAIKTITENLKAEGVKTRPLAVSHAFHSPLIEPMLDEFRQVVNEVTLSQPKRDLISNVSGKIATEEVTTVDYWVNHVRNAVRFADGVAVLYEQGVEVFLEIGPQPTLLSMAKRIKQSASKDEQLTIYSLPTLRQGRPDWQQILESLGELYVHGVNVDWASFDQDYARQKIQLPTYPFQQKRYWMDEAKIVADSGQMQKSSMLENIAQGNITALIEQLRGYDLLENEVELLPKLLGILAKQHQQETTFTDLQELFYEIEWQPKGRVWAAKDLDKSTIETTWLIFVDKQGTGSAFSQHLKDGGAKAVIEVYANETYQAESGGIYYLNPAKFNDFERLFDDKNLCSNLPLRIIHLWSLDAAPADKLTIQELDEAQILTCGSLLHLVQSLTNKKLSLKPELWLVTQGSTPIEQTEKPLTISQSLTWGFGKAIALEHPDIWGGMVDLGAEESPKNEVKKLLTVIQQPDNEDQIALRGKQQYVARLVRKEIQPSLSQKVSIHPDSSYLITGGLGTLGLETAQWLVDKGARYLILSGRSGITKKPKAQAKIKAFEEAGVTVLVEQADVSKQEGVDQMFDKVTSSMPQLQGVIHAAGVVNNQPIKDIHFPIFEEALQPKVQGGWLLHKKLSELKSIEESKKSEDKKVDLKFFVVYSSITSVWGTENSSAYIAANYFLDMLMHYRQAQGLAGLTINWGPWEGEGMAARLKTWFAQYGINTLPPQQAIEALGNLLQTNYTQIIVSDIVNWSHFKAFYGKKGQLLEQIAIAEEEDIEPQVAQKLEFLQQLETSPPDQQGHLLKDHLRTQIAHIMGLETSELNPQRGFQEMGMDSLMATELRKRLELNLKAFLPATLAFEYPTLEKLSAYLFQEIIEEGKEDPPEIEMMIPDQGVEPASLAIDAAELDEFSEDELAQLLASKLDTLN